MYDIKIIKKALRLLITYTFFYKCLLYRVYFTLVISLFLSIFCVTTTTKVYAEELKPYQPVTEAIATGHTSDGVELRDFPFEKENGQSMSEYIKSEIDYLVSIDAIPS